MATPPPPPHHLIQSLSLPLSKTNIISPGSLELPPKIKFLLFFYIKKFLSLHEARNHVFTVWIFNPIISHMFFCLSKNGLCM
jgi:hypothetical protein